MRKAIVHVVGWLRESAARRAAAVLRVHLGARALVVLPRGRARRIRRMDRPVDRDPVRERAQCIRLRDHNNGDDHVNGHARLHNDSRIGGDA